MPHHIASAQQPERQELIHRQCCSQAFKPICAGPRFEFRDQSNSDRHQNGDAMTDVAGGRCQASSHEQLEGDSSNSTSGPRGPKHIPSSAHFVLPRPPMIRCISPIPAATHLTRRAVAEPADLLLGEAPACFGIRIRIRIRARPQTRSSTPQGASQATGDRKADRRQQGHRGSGPATVFKVVMLEAPCAWRRVVCQRALGLPMVRHATDPARAARAVQLQLHAAEATFASWRGHEVGESVWSKADKPRGGCAGMLPLEADREGCSESG